MPDRPTEGVELHFITSTSYETEKESKNASRQLIRSIAGKHGKLSAMLPVHLRHESFETDFRTAKETYTSKIKLNSWVRKSGRKKKKLYNEWNSDEAQIEHFVLDKWHILIRELDPANPLPIILFPGTAALLHFWHGGMKTNSGALNPDGDWFDSIRDDSAALHAMISVVGSLQAFSIGKEVGPNIIKHEVEAVRLINERLRGEDGVLSDGVIAAAAVLVNQEALGHSFNRARIHMDGLVRMIDTRGGLQNMRCRVVLQRIITYADFCFSSAWGQVLRFPLLTSLLNYPDLDSTDRFIDLRLRSTQMGEVPNIDPGGNVFEAMELLYGITCCFATSLNSNTERIKLSNTIYLVEYMLCGINATPVKGVEPKCLDISAPLAAAAHLFLHLGIRNIPAKARRHAFLFHRLHDSLPEDLDLETWGEKQLPGIKLLLWLCAIGAVDEVDLIGRGRCIRWLEKLCRIMGVKSWEMFKACLVEVLWIEPFCEQYLKRVWHDVEAAVVYHDTAWQDAGLVEIEDYMFEI